MGGGSIVSRLISTIACAVICSAVLVGDAVAQSDEQLHTLTVDDLMKIEGFGSAQIDPSGRWAVYERIRPYDSISDYSFGYSSHYGSGHELYRLDLKSEQPAEKLPGIEQSPTTYLLGFSPSGRYLAIMQYWSGDMIVGSYDMVHERAVFFNQTPSNANVDQFRITWVSENEFVFSGKLLNQKSGNIDGVAGVRALTERQLSIARRNSWRGKVASAHELLSTSRSRSADDAVGSLIRADARTGKWRVLADGRFTDMRLSPNGRVIAALKSSVALQPDPRTPSDSDVSRHYTLVLLEPATGKRKRFERPVNVFPKSLVWSSNGQFLGFFAWSVGKSPKQGAFHVLDTISGTIAKYRHDNLDLASERERGFVQRPERAVFLGDKLAVFARSLPLSEHPVQQFTYKDVGNAELDRADWWLLGVGTAPRNLTNDLEGVSAIPVHAGKNHFTVVGAHGVFRIYADKPLRPLTPATGGTFRYLSAASSMVPEGLGRPEFQKSGLFVVDDGLNMRAVVVDFQDGHEGETVVVDRIAANATPLTGSEVTRSIIFREDDRVSLRLFVVVEGRPARMVDEINDHLYGISFGEWRTISYEVDDPKNPGSNRIIESCILIPPDYREGERRPLIVEVYPSVGPTCKNGAPSINLASKAISPYLWAARGFVYSRLTTPSDLIRTNDGPIAGIDEIILEGVDALVDKGYADNDRVSLFGFSQGGIASLYIAAQTERFRAIISINGWADLFSHYFEPNGINTYFSEFAYINPHRYESTAGSDFAMGRTPFDEPETFVRNSPVFLAPKIISPILLVHSDMDAFGMNQYDEMFGALYRLGKEARYVRYWGEGHGPSSPANIRDMWNRIDVFLNEYSTPTAN